MTTEKQLTNEDILKKLNKHGFAISSEKELNSLTHEDAKQTMNYVSIIWSQK